jgi:hypothetical protein
LKSSPSASAAPRSRRSRSRETSSAISRDPSKTVSHQRSCRRQSSPPSKSRRPGRSGGRLSRG